MNFIGYQGTENKNDTLICNLMKENCKLVLLCFVHIRKWYKLLECNIEIPIKFKICIPFWPNISATFFINTPQLQRTFH